VLAKSTKLGHGTKLGPTLCYTQVGDGARLHKRIKLRGLEVSVLRDTGGEDQDAEGEAEASTGGTASAQVAPGGGGDTQDVTRVAEGVEGGATLPDAGDVDAASLGPGAADTLSVCRSIYFYLFLSMYKHQYIYLCLSTYRSIYHLSIFVSISISR